jgi:hypothetical protein
MKEIKIKIKKPNIYYRLKIQQFKYKSSRKEGLKEEEEEASLRQD